MITKQVILIFYLNPTYYSIPKKKRNKETRRFLDPHLCDSIIHSNRLLSSLRFAQRRRGTPLSLHLLSLLACPNNAHLLHYINPPSPPTFPALLISSQKRKKKNPSNGGNKILCNRRRSGGFGGGGRGGGRIRRKSRRKNGDQRREEERRSAAIRKIQCGGV